MNLSKELGFQIHPEKSQLTPKQILEYLGFIINSRDMPVKLTRSNQGKVLNLIKNIISKETVSIRDIAKMIGTLEVFLGYNLADYISGTYSMIKMKHLKGQTMIMMHHVSYQEMLTATQNDEQKISQISSALLLDNYQKYKYTQMYVLVDGGGGGLHLGIAQQVVYGKHRKLCSISTF